jgi:hypothetical protein
VLTAAHCVANDNGAFVAPASDFSVVSGRTRLSSTEGTESSVSDYFYFVNNAGQQQYNPNTSGWDVALLQLASPAVGTPIKIAGADEAQSWALGRNALVSGWGSLNGPNGPFPDDLHAAEIAVLPDIWCSAFFNGIDPTSFCAGTSLGERDTCVGDSGGPMVVPLASGEYRLVGATSYGAEDCGSVEVPGVYTRVAADPVRTAVQGAAMQITGENVVGAGGQAPTTMTPNQARENAWIWVDADCTRWRPCRTYFAAPCSGSPASYRCLITETGVKRRTQIRCKRFVSVSAASGAIVRTPLGKWRCR